MSKYRVPVSIEAFASKVIGHVECDSVEEFHQKAEELWESQGWESPATNITNDFEIDGEWEIPEMKEKDLEFYKAED